MINENVVHQDIDDNRSEHRETERDEQTAQDDASPDHLKQGHNGHVAIVSHRPEEHTGRAFRSRHRHRYKMQKKVRPENHENKTE